ncbi:hypothetical protein ASC90_27430 [Rhizobium sp. Root1220]|nr:hypothetical protein ASC90_27430 [Rhizobium sp. Root1220]
MIAHQMLAASAPFRALDQASMRGHKTRQFLTVDHDSGSRFGRVWMGIEQAGHFGQIKGLLHIHDTHSLAAFDAINTDFDYAVCFLPLHE